MSKELKGTQTEKNLQTAFAGESQARNKYTYFASVAKKEGYHSLRIDTHENNSLLRHLMDLYGFVYCGKESMLFYDGYAIIAESSSQLEIIRRILSSKIFWYYISRTSKIFS